MSQPANNFKLGLFALAGVALLIAGLLTFGARSYFQPASDFETYIKGDVSGLEVGSPVELRGVRVGKVTGIDFSWTEYQPTQPSYIVVDFTMRNDIEPGSQSDARNQLLQSAINQGLRARLKAQGITGTYILSVEYVDPNENPPLKVPWVPRHTYIPSAPSEFNELLASLEKTLHNIENIDLNSLSQLISDDLKSAGQVLNNAKKIDFGELGTNANALLTDLRSSNTKLKSLIQDADNTVQKMKLERLSEDLDSLVGQLKDVVSRVGPGVASIDFNALNQTLSNARQTIRDLDDVLDELKRYPSGFIFGKPPAPIKGVPTPGTP